MSKNDWAAAQSAFNAVYQQVPGELAPKLALAVACEKGGLPEVAEGLYAVCAATDAAYVAPAAFGMARVRAARGDAGGAVEALDRVPRTSRGYPESRQLRAEVLLGRGALDLAVLDQAMRSIESASMDPATHGRYTVRILEHALAPARPPAGPSQPAGRVGSVVATEDGVRAAPREVLPPARPRHPAAQGACRARQPRQRRPGLEPHLMIPCPHCAEPLDDGAAFCEACGTQVGEAPAADATSVPVAEQDAPISAVTVPRRAAAAPVEEPPGRRPCLACGGDVGPDGYCDQCGAKAPSERDHFREQPAPWVAGVCDRGIRHTENEDAMALLASATPGERAVLVVMDGVSNTEDSSDASLAGARAARDVLQTPFPAGMGTDGSRLAAATAVHADAVAGPTRRS